jgi:hypothetical protein
LLREEQDLAEKAGGNRLRRAGSVLMGTLQPRLGCFRVALHHAAAMKEPAEREDGVRQAGLGRLAQPGLCLGARYERLGRDSGPHPGTRGGAIGDKEPVARLGLARLGALAQGGETAPRLAGKPAGDRVEDDAVDGIGRCAHGERRADRGGSKNIAHDPSCPPALMPDAGQISFKASRHGRQ